MRRLWEKKGSRPVGDFSIFSVRYDRSLSPLTGYEKEFTILETNDWVNVVPVTPEGRIVLVRQFRHGTRRYTVEIPGGGVDRSDRSADEAARRELLEETGYEAEEFLFLGVVEPNPAFQTNRCHTYLARGVVPVTSPHTDPGEEIEVLVAGEDEVEEMVRSGEIDHALVIAALYWYGRWKRKEGW